MMLHRHYDAIGREKAEKNGGVAEEKDVIVSEDESTSETAKRVRKRKTEE